MGTLAELEAAELSGRIGVLYGDLTKGTGFGARSAAYFPERDQKIVRLLEKKKPAALITVHSKTGSLERLIRDWEFPIPSATVPAEVGLTLLRHGSRTFDFQPERWTAISFKGDKDQADLTAEKLSQAIKPAWYANLSTETHAYVVFAGRFFKFGLWTNL